MKKGILSIVVSSLLLGGIAVASGDSLKLSSEEVSAKATKVATKKENTKVKLTQEAISSLELVTKAIESLDNHKSDEAKKYIESALGKLESILSMKDTPKLLPIENRVLVKNFVGSSKDVDVALKRVKALIDDGNIQSAGELLIGLQSEIDVTVVSLPLVTYPDALKLASKYIIEEKPERAKEVLELALSTMSYVKHIIPIPLVNSVDLVALASKEAKSDKELALKYLSAASDQLDKAEKLGYISDSATTYKELHKMIDDIKKEVEGPNRAEKLFIDLGEKLKEFKDKIFSSDKEEAKK